MAWNEAKETMGKMLRWTETAKDKKQEDSTIYIGNVVSGFYVGKKDNVGQNSSNVYEIKLASGELVSIWGSGLLDGKFKEIPLGCEVRVTYLGIEQPKTPKGRAYQNFKVEYDETSRTPMQTAGQADSKESANTSVADHNKKVNADFDGIGSQPPAQSDDGY